MSELPPIARTNYFDGEALLTADFVCEQRYHMEMLAALNRGLHIWGIASGLDVYWKHGVQSRQVWVSAGMAIDRLGREIILTSPKVVILDGLEAGALYYISIRYYEAYADLTDQTNVPGYKRIVQRPEIGFTRSPPDPGLDILLAVVRVSSDGAVNSLTYRAGTYERRYVGGRFGRLELLTQRSGIYDERSRSQPAHVTVSAHLEEAGAYLAFGARRSRFDGALSVGGNLGIGIEHPHADLQVSSAPCPGPGQCSSNDTTLTLTEPISPPLRPGDVVVPQISIAAPSRKPAWGVIAACIDASRYRLEKPFPSDLAHGHAYTYLRGVVAQIAAPVGDPTSSPRHLLRIDRDGTVALGMPATPHSGDGDGAAALSITPDRRVGIGLIGAPLSKARLEVNGDIQAGSLSVAGQILALGPVKAQSFEGNGAKLKNLPILGLWTKADPTSDVTPIYYEAGSVCVQTRKPFGALTVGSGRAFVGQGLVTLSKDDPDTLKGDQTRFLEYVNPGDKILVGALTRLEETVSQVISDTELVLEMQFPVLLLHAAYTLTAPGEKGPGKDGAGKISSNGTRILGIDTSFTKDVRPGDVLRAMQFTPNAQDARSGRMVGEVVGDDELKLVGQGAAPASGAESPGFVANLSAYMVQPALIGHFQDSNPLSDTSGAGRTTSTGEPMLNKPALLVVSNAMNSNAVAPNTVAINYELADIRPDYALMVDGPVNFSGSGHFDKLSVTELSVTDKAMVGGSLDPNSAFRLQVAGGDMRVDQSISIGANVGAKTISAAGDITASGALSGSALEAAGVNFYSDGSVGLFGVPTTAIMLTPQSSDQKDPNVAFRATTDGFVVAQIGVSGKKAYGSLECRASDRLVAATALSTTVEIKKKGTLTFADYRAVTMPVKKSDVVSIKLIKYEDLQEPTGWYYWMPLGPPYPAAPPATHAPSAPMPDSIATRPALVIDPEIVKTVVQRFVDDLVEISGRSPPADDLRKLAGGLYDLTCASQRDGASAKPEEIDTVVDMWPVIFGAPLSVEQKSIVAKGIADLVGARRPEVPARIEQFIDDVRQIPGTGFDDARRRKFRLGLLRMLGLDDDPDGR